MLDYRGFAKAGPPLTVTSPNLSWLEVLSGAEPSAGPRISQVASSSDLARAGALLPYSIVITNLGKVPLAAIDVRYTLALSARTKTLNFLYHGLSAKGLSSVLNPGETRILFPDAILNASFDPRSGSLSSGGRAAAGPGTNNSGLIVDLSNATAVTGAVDLVIATDGRMAGPDSAGTMKKFNQTAAAYSQLRDECLARLQRGDDDASVEAWLAPTAAQPVMRDEQTRSADRGAASSKQIASDWLSFLRNGQRQALQAKLESAPGNVVFSYLSLLKGELQ